ncbi:MAG: resolvase [Clostridia bacterium]|nr:resolvase [Clostridia bacterium]
MNSVNELNKLQHNERSRYSVQSEIRVLTMGGTLEELQTELLKLATSNADYDRVGDEIHRLRDQKQKLQFENVNHEELKKRIADMSTFLKEQPTDITEYDEQLIRRLIEKVTINEDKFTVEFKSGLTVDVDE